MTETDEATAAVWLQKLHQLSLVQASQNGRFRLHLLVRDYVREKIDASPKPDRLYERMATEFELRDRDRALSRKLELVSGQRETNMFGRAIITIYDRQPLVVVPKSAVQWDGCCNIARTFLMASGTW